MGRDEYPNLANKIRKQGRLFSGPAYGQSNGHPLRDDHVMQEIGIAIETHHHEVATAGQAEIDMVFDKMVAMADKLLKYKYVVKNVARRHNMVATFMPKPLFGDNGSGMHVHQSLWKGNTNIMYDEKGYGGFLPNRPLLHRRTSQARPALCAFICPTVNSYKRLTPGFRGAGQPGL